MKSSHLLATAVVVGLTLSSSANAMTVDTLTYNLGTLTSASAPSSITKPTSNSTWYNYTASGLLNAYTAVTFTYTATNVTPATYNELSDGTLGPNNTFLAFDSSSTSATAGALPVVVTANFNAGLLTGSVMIQNATSSAQNFSAYFTSLLTQDINGSTKVGYVVSSVPLPPAAILFMTGLLAVVGLGMRKKTQG